jgi:hypothetical protein
MFVSCHSATTKPYYLDGERIEGNLTPGPVFNGRIRFYDSVTNKLLAACDYRGGKKNGRYEHYFRKGGLESVSYFVNDLKNGKEWIYDTTGRLINEHDYYYGLRAGNDARYEYGRLKTYHFNDLEDKVLIRLDYDSLEGRRLTDILKDYYFYSFVAFGYANDTIHRRQYFLYTPNPPKVSFKYSLVKVDEKYNVLSHIMEFDQAKIWTNFIYDLAWNEPGKLVAIKLDIADSINHKEITSFKVLR